MSDNHTLKAVTASFDWTTYVESHYSCKYTNRGELRICCPSCADNKYKCYINPEKGLFNCFRCSFKSGNRDVFDFVAITEGIPRGKAVLRLFNDYTPTTPNTLEAALEAKFAATEPPPVGVLKAIPGLPKEAVLLTPESSLEAWQYLLDRGMTPAEIKSYTTYVIPQKSCVLLDSTGTRRGDIGKRVLWPIYGGDHVLVSWQARTTDPAYARGDKYLGCPESEMAKTFWPYVPPKDSHVVLVEGIFDAMAVRRAGFSAYCVFGKQISVDQLKLLRSWGVKEVTIFFDKKDAKREIEKAKDKLLMYVDKVSVLPLAGWPKTQDAGDLLRHPDGVATLQTAINARVDVLSTAFVSWKISF